MNAMNWYVEDGLAPLMAAAAVVIVMALWSGGLGSTRLRVIAAAVVTLGLMGPVVDAAVVTPTEQLSDTLHALADHVVDGDGEAAAALMADTPENLAAYVRRVAERVDVHDDLRLSDVTVTLLPGERVGKTHFRANGTVTVLGTPSGDWSHHRPTRWILEWQREDDGVWRVRDVTMLNPISGREISVWRRI